MTIGVWLNDDVLMAAPLSNASTIRHGAAQRYSYIQQLWSHLPWPINDAISLYKLIIRFFLQIRHSNLRTFSPPENTNGLFNVLTHQLPKCLQITLK